MVRQLGILVGPHSQGSNMLAIHQACKQGMIPAAVGVVIAPSEKSPAALHARSLGIEVAFVPPGHEFGPRLLKALGGIDIVCLAGFLRLVPAEILAAFEDRILNIHPALLPEFGGKGMYGRHVHEAVLKAKKEESGCTVHLVNENYDEGKILVQKRVPVFHDDTPETLAARVLEQEHIAFPEAIRFILDQIEQQEI